MQATLGQCRAEQWLSLIHICYLVDVAQSFNKFYHDNIILADDENVKNARLALVDAVRTVIKSGLAILGIDAPEQM